MADCMRCEAQTLAHEGSVVLYTQLVEEFPNLLELLAELGLKLAGAHPFSLPLKFFELGHRLLQTFPGHPAKNGVWPGLLLNSLLRMSHRGKRRARVRGGVYAPAKWALLLRSRQLRTFWSV